MFLTRICVCLTLVASCVSAAETGDTHDIIHKLQLLEETNANILTQLRGVTKTTNKLATDLKVTKSRLVTSIRSNKKLSNDLDEVKKDYEDLKKNYGDVMKNNKDLKNNYEDIRNKVTHLESKLDLQVRLPPNIVDGPQGEITYSANSELQLPCIGFGVPLPHNYEWYKNGQFLDIDSHPNIEMDPDANKGSITISPATGADEGSYQCWATNTHGTSLSDLVLLTQATLEEFPDELVKEYEVQEADSLEISCDPPKSVPNAFYSWSLLNDSSPVESTPRINVDDNGNLLISHTIPTDEKDAFLYTCNVFNEVMNQTVQGAFSSVTVLPYEDEYKEPEVSYATQSPVLGLINKEFILRCLFSGKPEAVIVWRMAEPERELPEGRHEISNFNSQLRVFDLESEDAAVYTCTGVNVDGMVTHEITVSIGESPHFVSEADRPHRLTATRGESVDIKCDPQAQPAADITWFINGQQVDGNNLGPRMALSADNKTLTISDVCRDCEDRASDLMNLQCYASNIHGGVFADGYINIIETSAFTAISLGEGIIIIPPGEPVIFDHLYTDVGGDYDTSTGRFTCPVTGLYLFSVTLITTSSTSYRAYADIVKDGVRIARILSSYGNQDSGGNTVVTHCMRSEQVWVESVHSNCGLFGYSYPTFTGALLHRM